MSGRRDLVRRGGIPLMVAFVVVLLPIIAVLCAASFLVSQGSMPSRFLASVGDDGQAWIRSAGAATASSCLIVAIAVFAGTGVAAMSLRRGASAMSMLYLAPLAIVPLLLGTASFSFLYRDAGASIAMAVGGSGRGSVATASVEVVAQLIRYVPLALWLLVLAVMQTPSAVRAYIRQNAINAADYSNIHLMSRWLIALLIVAAFAFQDSANDYFITQLALKPSIATHSELIAHALGREYLERLSLGPPERAIAGLVVTGALAALSFAAVFAVLSWVLLHWAQAAPKRSLEFHGRRAPRAGGGGGPAAIIVGSIAALMICSVPAVSSSGWPRFGQLLPSVFLSLTAAALAWVIAAPVIFALRNNLRIDDGSATRAILQVGAIAIAIGFIPSLALAASILGLAYQFDIVGDSTNGLLLLLSQTLRFTPVAFVLLAPATLGVPDGQLDYMKRIGTTARERFNVTFLHPNFRLHCATLLIIFNLVLNEAVISGVFQGEVPNLADFATRAVTGRSADYGFVGSIILLQLCLFGTLLGIWGRTSATAWSLRNAER